MPIEIPVKGNRYFLAFLVLGLSLLAMVLIWGDLNSRHAQNLQAHFKAESDRISTKISIRIESNIQILRGAAGLFAASHEVDRSAWQRYVEKLELDQTHRGIQGVGFSLYIPANQLPTHMQNVRRLGFPDYIVRPEGQRTEYTSIIYLEPFAGRNLRAFGFDMYSEPMRRAAMQAARDSASVQLSGKVHLVQETQTDVQAGVLAFHPVYASNAFPQTVDQRRKALIGWTYSPYRMDDLVESIVREDLGTIRLEIFDGEAVEVDALLFDSEPKHTILDAGDGSTLLSKTLVAGRTWTLRYTALPGFSAGTKFEPPWVEFSAIAVIGLLLFGITWTLLNTRRRAQVIAAKLTESLRTVESQFRATFEQSAVGIAHFDPATSRFMRVNHRLCSMLGYTRSEMEAMSFLDVTHPEDLHLGDDHLRELVAGNLRSFQLEKRYLRKDGSVLWGGLTVSAVLAQDGSVSYVIPVIEDITQRKTAEAALAKLDRELRAAQRLGHIGNWKWDLPSNTHSWSAEIYAIYGRDPLLGPATYPDVEKYFSPETWTLLGKAVNTCVSDGVSYQCDALVLREDGSRRWVVIFGEALRDPQGKVVVLHGTVQDITERKQMENEVRDSETRLQTIIQNEPECIKTVDAQGLLRQMNPAGLAMIEADSLEQVAGQPVIDLIAPEFRDTFLKMHQSVLAGESAKLEFQVLGLKGGRRWLETHAVPMMDQGQTVQLAVTRDITERKQLEDQIRQLAFHDTLTKLPNRRLLMDRLAQTMAASKRSGRYAAMMFLDLDNFKALNDSQGHEVGDLLLLEVAKRLLACVREIDTVARFGGDEFVVMLSELSCDKTESHAQASVIAEKIRSALAEPYRLTVSRKETSTRTVTHLCTASIGVTLFLGHDGVEDDILRCADSAMYTAKDAGRNTIRYHDNNVL